MDDVAVLARVLSKRYRFLEAVKSISFEVPAQSCFGFLGPMLFGDPMRQSFAGPSEGIVAASMEIDTSVGQPFRSKPALARRLPGMYRTLLKQD